MTANAKTLRHEYTILDKQNGDFYLFWKGTNQYTLRLGTGSRKIEVERKEIVTIFRIARRFHNRFKITRWR